MKKLPNKKTLLTFSLFLLGILLLVIGILGPLSGYKLPSIFRQLYLGNVLFFWPDGTVEAPTILDEWVGQEPANFLVIFFDAEQLEDVYVTITSEDGAWTYEKRIDLAGPHVPPGSSYYRYDNRDNRWTVPEREGVTYTFKWCVGQTFVARSYGQVSSNLRFGHFLNIATISGIICIALATIMWKKR